MKAVWKVILVKVKHKSDAEIKNEAKAKEKVLSSWIVIPGTEPKPEKREVAWYEWEIVSMWPAVWQEFQQLNVNIWVGDIVRIKVNPYVEFKSWDFNEYSTYCCTLENILVTMG